MTITRVDGLEMFAKMRHGPFIDTSEALRTCPFCGSEAGYREDPRDKSLRVECSNTSCGVATPYHYRTQDLALKAWNRTAPITVYSLEARYKYDQKTLLCGLFLTRQGAEEHKSVSVLDPDSWEIDEWKLGERKGENAAHTRTVSVPQIGLRYTVTY